LINLLNVVNIGQNSFFGDFQKDDVQAKLINGKQFERVVGMLKTTKGKIIQGGHYDEKTNRFELTIVKCTLDDPTIGMETFGPILWVVSVGSVKEAVEFINTKHRSLSLYLFSKNKQNQNFVSNNTSSGAVQINGVITYAAHGQAPFGGVGNSGMGSYHGLYSFKAFTHLKPVVKSLAEMPLLYPPYPEWKEKVFRFVFRLN